MTREVKSARTLTRLLHLRKIGTCGITFCNSIKRGHISFCSVHIDISCSYCTNTSQPLLLHLAIFATRQLSFPADCLQPNFRQPVTTTRPSP